MGRSPADDDSPHHHQQQQSSDCLASELKIARMNEKLVWSGFDSHSRRPPSESHVKLTERFGLEAEKTSLLMLFGYH